MLKRKREEDKINDNVKKIKYSQEFIDKIFKEKYNETIDNEIKTKIEIFKNNEINFIFFSVCGDNKKINRITGLHNGEYNKNLPEKYHNYTPGVIEIPFYNNITKKEVCNFRDLLISEFIKYFSEEIVKKDEDKIKFNKRKILDQSRVNDNKIYYLFMGFNTKEYDSISDEKFKLYSNIFIDLLKIYINIIFDNNDINNNIKFYDGRQVRKYNYSKLNKCKILNDNNITKIFDHNDYKDFINEQINNNIKNINKQNEIINCTSYYSYYQNDTNLNDFVVINENEKCINNKKRLKRNSIDDDDNDDNNNDNNNNNNDNDDNNDIDNKNINNNKHNNRRILDDDIDNNTNNTNNNNDNKLNDKNDIKNNNNILDQINILDNKINEIKNEIKNELNIKFNDLKEFFKKGFEESINFYNSRIKN